jgi:tetratricopeptide (TPR) repeat protein
LGEHEEAVLLNKRAIQLFNPLRSHGVAWALFQMGQIFRDRGQLVKAWETVRETLNLQTDISNQKGIGWAEAELGQVHLALNDQSHARESLIRAKVAADKLDSLPLKAEVGKSVAQFYMDEGLLQKALTQLDESEALAKKIQAWETLTEIFLAKARYGLIVGDWATAREAIKSANSLVETHSLLRLKPAVGLHLGELLAVKGESAKAAMVFREVADLAKKIRQRRQRAEALLGLLQLQRNEKSSTQISLNLYYLEKDARAISSRKLKAKFFAVKGVVLSAKRGAVDSKSFSQSLQIAESAGLPVLKRQILDVAAELYFREGQLGEAREYQDETTELLKGNLVDLHLVYQRRELMDRLPVSIVS